MASSYAVQVKLELGHRAQVRKKPTVEGFTHDWLVFVRGPEHSNIQHFVEKVVFHLHESFPRPKRERGFIIKIQWPYQRMQKMIYKMEYINFFSTFLNPYN
nr:PREDICTED: protein AF-9 [Latimeria chalumnae]|eukprot:XP_006007719.1 PREDICTED: protein AF-9 [Latimeria chalumnae]